MPLQKVGEGIERFLSHDERSGYGRCCRSDMDEHAEHPELRKHALHRLLEFDVSIRTGMRKSEQFNLRWQYVDFDRRIMRLRKTKNGKARNAYMIDDVIRALKQLKELNLDRRSGPRRQIDPALSDIFCEDGEQEVVAACAQESADHELSLARQPSQFLQSVGAGWCPPEGGAGSGWPRQYRFYDAVCALCYVTGGGCDGGTDWKPEAVPTGSPISS